MSVAAIRTVGNPSSAPRPAPEDHDPGFPGPASETERPDTEREAPRR